MRNHNYETKQKDLILDVIKKQKKEFLIKDIYKELKDQVGLTTIYRLIEKLEEDNLINKTIKPNNTTYYEYIEKCEEDNHFYLKCNKCGTLTHVDCDCINDLYNHVYKEHDFTLDKEKIIIKGICKNCK